MGVDGVVEFDFVNVEDEDAVAEGEEVAGDAAADAAGAAGEEDAFTVRHGGNGEGERTS